MKASPLRLLLVSLALTSINYTVVMVAAVTTPVDGACVRRKKRKKKEEEEKSSPPERPFCLSGPPVFTCTRVPFA